LNILSFEPFAQQEGHFGVYTSQVSQELADLGNAVTVVTTRLDAKNFLSSPPRFRIIETGRATGNEAEGRSGFLKSALRGVGLILGNARALLALLRTWRAGNFDVVHFFDFEPVSTVLILGLYSLFFRARLTPLCVVVHAPDPSFQAHGNILYQIYGRLSRPALRIVLSRYADVITAHGTWAPGELESLLGLGRDDGRIRFVPYGTVVPDRTPSRAEARGALGLDAGETVLLFFGMLRKDKGVELLIEAMGGVKGDCRLILAGTPFDWRREDILRMIRDRHAEERVLPMLEYIPEPDIPRYFAAADALVLPYKRNYMGAAGPLKTAMGFGLPVIATEVRELSEFMKLGRIGISSEPENADSLRTAIERFLATGAAERAEMSETGRRLAKRFSWSVLAEAFARIYQSLTTGNGRPSDRAAREGPE
jgi:glycosyltransferase involved in cell wall biosynthesis